MSFGSDSIPLSANPPNAPKLVVKAHTGRRRGGPAIWSMSSDSRKASCSLDDLVPHGARPHRTPPAITLRSRHVTFDREQIVNVCPALGVRYLCD